MSDTAETNAGTSPPIRAKRASLRRTVFVLAFAVLVVIGVVAVTMGARLYDITNLAMETQNATIPESVSQNRHALEAERLARYAELVLRVPDDAARAESAELAAQLAAGLASDVDGRLKSSVNEAGRLIAEGGHHRRQQLLDAPNARRERRERHGRKPPP